MKKSVIIISLQGLGNTIILLPVIKSYLRENKYSKTDNISLIVSNNGSSKIMEYELKKYHISIIEWNEKKNSLFNLIKIFLKIYTIKYDVLFAAFPSAKRENILTFLMVPIATTFAKNVSLLGCDGRPITQDDYFWKHENSVQFNDKMEGIKRVHPAFFKIDYNDYYTQHCESLQQQIEFAEAHGFAFNCNAYSHIPALQKRMRHSGKTDKHYIHRNTS